MNKLTKQLLSLGLSVVTVAGMVSPVLADDEVNAVEPTEETTAATEQSTEEAVVNELVTRTITLHITKDGQTTSTEFNLDVNATDDYVTSYIMANCVPEGYRIDGKGVASSLQKVSDTEWQMALVKKEEQKPEEALQTFNIKVVFSDKTQKDYENTFESTRNDAFFYIIENFIPEGYKYVDTNGIDYNEAANTYTLTLYKVKSIKLDSYLDGVKDTYTSEVEVPYDYTDKEIKNYIEERYSTGKIESITKVDDNAWVIKCVTVKDEAEDYTVYINKDGVETSQKIHVSKDDQYMYGGMYQYLKINCVPDGYHVDYKKGASTYKGIVGVGSDSYRIYLAKNNDKPVMKKFTVKILKTTMMGEDYFNNSEVEYHTFEYDSKDTTGIEDYVIKKFSPKGYVISSGPVAFDVYQIDDLTYGAIACKMPEKQVDIPKITTYKLHYIDSATNKEVYLSAYSNDGGKLDSIKASDITYLPVGYVFDGNSFEVSNIQDEGSYLVNVYVKKGEFKTPTTINFYRSDNGKLIQIKSVNTYAQDLDLDKDGMVSTDELEFLCPSGYKRSGLSFSDEQIHYTFANDSVYTNYVLGIYLEELSTVATPSSSKDTASISGVNSNEVLANSLTKEQKKKYDVAVKEGKKIEFKPVVKNEVNASDKKLLLAYADKADAEVVNAFDIEIELVIDDKNEGLISETDGKLTFKVAIPENLKKDGRKFYVLRAHDGKVEKLPVNEDGSFETDKFSSYMLVYEDVKATTPETKPEVKPGNNTETNPVVRPETKPAAKPSTGSTTNTTDTKKKNTVKKDVKKNKKVNTSTKTSSTLFTGLLGVSIVGLGAVEVLRRRNK